MFEKIRNYYKRMAEFEEAAAIRREQERTANRNRKERERNEKERQVRLAQEQEKRNKQINELGRSMQVSLFQLPDSPDLQRQRSWVLAAKDVPISFRRRQFSRFKDMLETACARMIRSGVPREALLQDLRAIVTGLGVASFEADYIINSIPEMPIGAASPPIDPNVEFQQRILRIHDDHMSRLKAIDSIQNLDEEDRLQLVEAEVDRFRKQLFGKEEQA